MLLGPPDLNLKFRPEDPLVIDLSLKPWPDDPSPPVVENPWLKLGSLDHLFYPEKEIVSYLPYITPMTNGILLRSGMKRSGLTYPSSLRLSLLSLFIFFFSVAFVLPSFEVLPYVLDVLILCLWVVFYPSYWDFFGLR